MLLKIVKDWSRCTLIQHYIFNLLKSDKTYISISCAFRDFFLFFKEESLNSKSDIKNTKIIDLSQLSWYMFGNCSTNKTLKDNYIYQS